MDVIVLEMRRAMRALMHAPLFTGSAVLVLSLGIGANIAIFSVVDSVLLRPLPFASPDRLLVLWETNLRRKRDRNVVSPANFLDWRAQSRSFSSMAAFVDWRAALSGAGDGEPEEIPVELATASLFPMLGVGAVRGRVFGEADDTPTSGVMVLSDALWRRRFGADPSVIGRTVRVNGRPTTIIGVMPPDFALPGSRADAWLPLGLDPTVNYRVLAGRYLTSIARLAPGVSAEAARNELSAIARRLESVHPEFNANWGVNPVALHEQAVGSARPALLVLIGVVALVLLIACANVANLQLVRAAGRERELALRAALGAGRGRIARELLAESACLAVAGALGGALLASWGVGTLIAIAGDAIPHLGPIGVDRTALAYALVLALVAALLSGVLPAWRASRGDLHTLIAPGARGTGGGRRLRSALVAAQVALSLVLLIGAGLLLRSFARLQAVSPGFNPDHVLAFRIDLPGSRYADDTRRTQFFEQSLDRVRALPGVTEAGVIDWLPFSGGGSATSYTVDGRPPRAAGDDLVADVRSVDDGFFRAMRLTTRQGRLFNASARAGTAGVAVINETMARTVFAGQSAIGQHITMDWGDTLHAEIVAVVADIRHMALDSVPRPMILWPVAQKPTTFASFVIRTSGDPIRLLSAVGAAIHGLDPELPLADARPMDDFVEQTLSHRRLTTFLLGSFALIALVLAMVGLWGAMAHTVALRTREIGVRMALGAHAGEVVQMVVREGLVVVGSGALVGLALSLSLAPLLGSLLFETSPIDPVTLACVVAALGSVALLASWLPARRAARIDPVDALRTE